MGRPIYSHELSDPDFSWLITSFQENNPNYSCVDSSCLPIVFISLSLTKESTDEKEEEILVSAKAKRPDFGRLVGDK
jgi:hypothetical protein